MKLILFGVVTVLFHSISSMSHEQITCVPDDVYKDGDYLAFILYECSENVHEINFTDEHPSYFGCTNWDLSGLSTRVYQINFSNCQMSKIEYDYIKKYPNLVKFDASFTGLEQLSKETFKGGYLFQRFNASHNNISIIPLLLFLHAENMETVDFSCNKIERFERFALSGAKKLTFLDVSHNFLDHIEADYFDSALNLEHLNLSHNNISEVAAMTFKALTKLTTLDLSFNNITKLSKNMFDSLTNLQSLHLSNLANQTIEIEPSAFTGLDSLQVLDLSHNHITAIETGMFEGLSNVRTIALNGMNIKRIERLAFAGLDSITELDLSNNPTVTNSSAETMIFIDREAFDDLTNLTLLNLANNPVGNLSVGTFSKLINLQHLNLSNIQLSEIRLGTFSGLKNLLILDLSKNQLKKFDFIHLLSSKMDLQQLYLSGNHLIELDGYRPYSFHKLSVADISVNRFNCSYLRQFLSESYVGPYPVKFSNQMSFNPYEDNIHGIRCIPNDGVHNNNEFSYITTTSFATTLTAPKSSAHEMIELVQQNSFDVAMRQMARSLNDLHVMKILLFFICVILIVMVFVILILIIINRHGVRINHRYSDFFEQRQSSFEVSNF